MTELILFHHAQGLTDGVRAFADELRSAGHRVTVPDLYDGQTFATLEAGVAHAQRIGFGTLIARGELAAAALPTSIVYAGFSLGVLPAQKLAQTRSGALGAILYHGAISIGEFAPTWPSGVGLQMHFSEADPWSADDKEAACHLAAAVDRCELHLYAGSGHLIADRSLSEYDPKAAALILERSLAFLERVSTYP